MKARVPYPSTIAYLTIAATALAVAVLLARAELRAAPESASRVLHDISVPMRDSVILRADVLLPQSVGRYPTLIYRTPYGKHFAIEEYQTFQKAVARGYAVVVEDVRGRYASDGEFNAYRNEGHDGYDTIEWAAKQEWSDGNVGSFGLSYPGAVQWLAAVENPPHLKAMVPAMTFSTPRNFFYSGGVFDGSWIDWIWMNIAPDVRQRKNLPGPRTHREAAAAWKEEHQRLENYLPLRDLPDFKEIAPFYYEWLSHPPADNWWEWAELRNKYSRVRAAVLNFSGWYDEAYGPDGATANFNGLLQARASEGDPRTRTVIGPWTHGGQEQPKAGERTFPAEAAIDYDELILRWMDHYLRGIQNGVDREKRVRLYVMGDNLWRDEDRWPLPEEKQQVFFLGAPAGRSEKRAPGTLTRSQMPEEQASEFLSDPSRPLSDPFPGYGAHDYRSFAGREDVLVFDSEAMSERLEVTGPIRAEVYASCECRDFDLWVRLLDVAPDGTAFNLMSPGLDVQRVSDLAAGAKPDLAKPHQVVKVTLDRLLTSNTFLPGHRVRVQISGAFFPHFSRNLQTGRSEVTSSESTAARIRILHGKKFPSHIVLPVISR